MYKNIKSRAIEYMPNRCVKMGNNPKKYLQKSIDNINQQKNHLMIIGKLSP